MGETIKFDGGCGGREDYPIAEVEPTLIWVPNYDSGDGHATYQQICLQPGVIVTIPEIPKEAA